VESYKKSIENLNSTHNSTREKLVQAREETKAAREENILIR
jgi:hypothetical protein